tara:strand:- start:1 stop:231 length:231 start_codon:yes stop_codon:yes gene_type:complete
MFGNSILYGIGIGLISTGVYYVVTYDKTKEDRKDCLIIFSIICLVSILILYITSGNSESVILNKSLETKLNNTPPF